MTRYFIGVGYEGAEHYQILEFRPDAFIPHNNIRGFLKSLLNIADIDLMSNKMKAYNVNRSVEVYPVAITTNVISNEYTFVNIPSYLMLSDLDAAILNNAIPCLPIHVK